MNFSCSLRRIWNAVVAERHPAMFAWTTWKLKAVAYGKVIKKIRKFGTHKSNLSLKHFHPYFGKVVQFPRERYYKSIPSSATELYQSKCLCLTTPAKALLFPNRLCLTTSPTPPRKHQTISSTAQQRMVAHRNGHSQHPRKRLEAR